MLSIQKIDLTKLRSPVTSMLLDFVKISEIGNWKLDFTNNTRIASTKNVEVSLDQKNYRLLLFGIDVRRCPLSFFLIL